MTGGGGTNRGSLLVIATGPLNATRLPNPSTAATVKECDVPLIGCSGKAVTAKPAMPAALTVIGVVAVVMAGLLRSATRIVCLPAVASATVVKVFLPLSPAWNVASAGRLSSGLPSLLLKWTVPRNGPPDG